jgi:membrane fusion protein, heavy metal efflux system
MKTYPASTLFTALALATFVSCAHYKKEKKPDTRPEGSNALIINDSSLNLMNVTLGKPESKIIESAIYLSGKVVTLPNYRALVSSDLEGKVEKIFVREGDFVKKHQTLFTLRSMAFIELQNQYFEALSELDFLEIEYQRQQELIHNNIGALAEFQTTESKRTASKSKVGALKAKLRLLGIEASDLSKTDLSPVFSITAPIEGYLIRLPVNIGELATNEMTLAEVVNTSKLMAEIYAYDNDLDDVQEGQEVEIDFINHSFPNVKGIVENISRAFDPATKSVRIHVRFEAPTGKMILPDMSIRCVVTKNESKVALLTVPLSSVLREEDHQFVFLTYPSIQRIGENTLLKCRVVTGAQNEKEVQIQFANIPEPGYLVVTQNTMIIENERKKRTGMAIE